MYKKIFLIILFFICFSKKINAEVFYGDYYKVDELSNFNDDEIKIDSYKVFNTYDISYEDMGYMKDNDIYIKDDNNFVYEKQLTDDNNIGDECITINLSNKNKEKLGLKLRLGYGLKIYELEIFHNGEKIDYEVGNKSKFDNANLNISNISDNNLETYYSHDTRYLYVFIKFFEEYNLDEIEIIIHTKKDNDSILSVYFDNRPIATLNNNIDRRHIVRFNIVEENVGLIEYKYKYDIKLYKYYKENKVKKDIYVKEGNNLILDDYNIINEYYIRDKIVLDDNLIIDDKSKNVNDYIKYSSDKVDVLCDINYEINGVYKCRFKLNELEFEKDFIVDIKDDLIETDRFDNTLNEEIEDIQENLEEVGNDKLLNGNVINKETEEITEKIDELVNDVLNKETEAANNKNEINENIMLNDIIVSKNETVAKYHFNNKRKDEKVLDNKIKNNGFSNSINNITKKANDNYDIKEGNNKKNNNIKIIIILILIFINIYMLIKRIRHNVESV